MFIANEVVLTDQEKECFLVSRNDETPGAADSRAERADRSSTFADGSISTNELAVCLTHFECTLQEKKQ